MRTTQNVEVGAVQKSANLVELEKSCKMSLWLQKSASIQPRSDLPKFGLPVCRYYRYTGASTDRIRILQAKFATLAKYRDAAAKALRPMESTWPTGTSTYAYTYPAQTLMHADSFEATGTTTS